MRSLIRCLALLAGRASCVADALESPDALDDLMAMSGGGRRSTAFADGSLKGLRDMTIPAPDGSRPLLNAAPSQGSGS